MNKIYTTEQAAEILNSTAVTVRQLIKDGKLKAFFKLRKYYILHSDLVDYLKR
jgi:excisionase family DNA binding protein